MSDYRRNLQQLKFESDVVNEKAVRKMYDEAFKNWRANKSNESAFKVLCLAAYFPPISFSSVTLAERNEVTRCFYLPGDYSNIEYAFVAACAFKEDHQPNMDPGMLDVFKQRAPNDPLLGALSYSLSDTIPAMKDCIETIKRLSEKYPLRDEYWLAKLMKANWSLWSASGRGEENKAETIKIANAVLAHPQTGPLSRESARIILKMVNGGS